jgi:hypothetical protein
VYCFREATRRPCHFEHVAGVDELGDALSLLLLGVTLVMFSVSNCIDREIETVKMHGVRIVRGIDHTPVSNFSHFVRGESPVLGSKEIRDANSSDGLNLASWAAILCPQNGSDRTQVQVELMTTFMQEHSGFKLKEIIGQQNERIMMEVVSNSGGLFWNCAQQRYVEAHNFDVEKVLQHPFILGATPKTAREHLSWTTTLFQYSSPRMYPRPTEQKLLRAAMKGSKDAELSRELGVSLSFVKKTWCSIYKRAFEKLPELNLDIATDSIAQRGREKKQRVLSYLREHPEELRPISSSKLRL